MHVVRRPPPVPRPPTVRRPPPPFAGSPASPLPRLPAAHPRGPPPAAIHRRAGRPPVHPSGPAAPRRLRAGRPPALLNSHSGYARAALCSAASLFLSSPRLATSAVQEQSVHRPPRDTTDAEGVETVTCSQHTHPHPGALQHTHIRPKSFTPGCAALPPWRLLKKCALLHNFCKPHITTSIQFTKVIQDSFSATQRP